MIKHTPNYTSMLAGIFAICVISFYFPGLITGDAAFQFVQIRTDQINNLHPPLMAWLWQSMDDLGLHYGWFWALPLLAYWLLCAICAKHLFQRTTAQLAALALLTLTPPLFYLFTAIWKDSFMLVGLMMMVTALLSRAKGSTLLFLAGLLLTIFIRHNALPAVLPFLFLWLLKPCACHIRAAIYSITAMLVVGVIGWGINQAPEHRTSMWPTIGLWDLAAISIDQQDMLLPESAWGVDDLTLEEMQREFSPLSNTTLCRYIEGRGRLVSCMQDLPLIRGNLLPSSAVKPLTAHWLHTIAEHPISYIKHRLRITCYLLDICSDPNQPGIIVNPFPQAAYEGHWYEGPPAEELGIVIESPRDEAINVSYALRWLRYHTPLMSPWLYFLLLTSTILPLLKHRTQPIAQAGLAVNASAWLLALPLVIIVPNLQIRYLIWPICASIFCLLCYLSLRNRST